MTEPLRHTRLPLRADPNYDEIVAFTRLRQLEKDTWTAILRVRRPSVISYLEEALKRLDEVAIDFDHLETEFEKFYLRDPFREWMQACAALTEDASLTPGIEQIKKVSSYIVEQNLKLIWHHVLRRHAANADAKDDMIQDGVLGLMRAVEMFDLDRGYRFVTYAMWWIKQAISKHAYFAKTVIRYPAQIVDMDKRVSKAQHAHYVKHGTFPSVEVLSSALEISKEAVRVSLEMRQQSQYVYLNAPVSGENEKTFEDLLIAEMPEMEEHLDVARLKQIIQRALDSLTDIQRAIILRRFGFEVEGAEEDETLRKVGRDLGFTGERIRQIEARALQKLRGVILANLKER